MDGGFNAVVLLDIQFRELVVLEGRSFLDITQSGGINNVSDQESLDSLILRDSLSGGRASKGTSVRTRFERKDDTSLTTATYSHEFELT